MFVNNNHPTELCVLVMDVGNTSIKWALFLKNDIIWRGRDHEIDDHAFEVNAVYFASVRDDSSNLLLLEEVGKRYPNASVLDLKVSAVACGVENAYSEPHRLGIDRWLGVLYVHSQYQGTVVVVDAGTAVKIDVVNSDGRHLGGYIAPSSDMMEKSLVANTGRIRYSEADMTNTAELPRNTGQAVRFGCNEMVLGFIERIVSRYPSAKCVFTGGNGERIMEQLVINETFDPDLVLKGAKLLGDERILMS